MEVLDACRKPQYQSTRSEGKRVGRKETKRVGDDGKLDYSIAEITNEKWVSQVNTLRHLYVTQCTRNKKCARKEIRATAGDRKLLMRARLRAVVTVWEGRKMHERKRSLNRREPSVMRAKKVVGGELLVEETTRWRSQGK